MTGTMAAVTQRQLTGQSPHMHAAEGGDSPYRVPVRTSTKSGDKDARLVKKYIGMR